MKKLPESFLNSLEGVPGFDRQAFEKVHESGDQVTSVRLNPLKTEVPGTLFQQDKKEHIPWTEYGFYLPQRPSFTFDPLFHAGLYYVQEASSMFLEQAFRQLTVPGQPMKVLDLCAAPGGKSTHIQSLLPKESLVVSNEVVKNRNHILVDNIVKWGAPNVIVTISEPAHFQKIGGFF